MRGSRCLSTSRFTRSRDSFWPQAVFLAPLLVGLTLDVIKKWLSWYKPDWDFVIGVRAVPSQECFTVANQRFCYSDFVITTGFHKRRFAWRAGPRRPARVDYLSARAYPQARSSTQSRALRSRVEGRQGGGLTEGAGRARGQLSPARNDHNLRTGFRVQHFAEGSSMAAIDLGHFPSPALARTDRTCSRPVRLGFVVSMVILIEQLIDQPFDETN